MGNEEYLLFPIWSRSAPANLPIAAHLDEDYNAMRRIVGHTLIKPAIVSAYIQTYQEQLQPPSFDSSASNGAGWHLLIAKEASLSYRCEDSLKASW